MPRTTEELPGRLAFRIAESAACNRVENITTTLRASAQNLQDLVGKFRRQQSRFAKAIQHGWFLAARRILSDGRFDRDAWSPAWDKYCRAVDEFLHRCPAGLSHTELHTELQELTREFQDVEWDQQHLWVTTEPIVLEGIDLGRFQVRLCLDSIGGPTTDGGDFGVVALDPNPAGANHEVTHPHVSANRLCQGEATGPIRLALEQGRLVDFFHIVRSVLLTYNVASPFVELDEWDGVRCSDCGDNVSTDEISYCEACEENFCDACSGRCYDCGAIRCSACLPECRGCGEAFCSSCLSACEACGTKGFCDSCLKACAECGRKEFCADCLEYDLCASCRDKQVLENNDANDNDEAANERDTTEPAASPVVGIPAGEAATADAGVCADGVAQASVPVSSG